jgi:hypothetical protein
MGRITYPPKAELRLVLVKVAAATEDNAIGESDGKEAMKRF